MWEKGKHIFAFRIQEGESVQKKWRAALKTGWESCGRRAVEKGGALRVSEKLATAGWSNQAEVRAQVSRKQSAESVAGELWKQV